MSHQASCLVSEAGEAKISPVFAGVVLVAQVQWQPFVSALHWWMLQTGLAMDTNGSWKLTQAANLKHFQVPGKLYKAFVGCIAWSAVLCYVLGSALRVYVSHLFLNEQLFVCILASRVLSEGSDRTVAYNIRHFAKLKKMLQVWRSYNVQSQSCHFIEEEGFDASSCADVPV